MVRQGQLGRKILQWCNTNGLSAGKVTFKKHEIAEAVSYPSVSPMAGRTSAPSRTAINGSTLRLVHIGPWSVHICLGSAAHV